MTQPVILAFDTSGPWVGVAVLGGADVLAAQHGDMAKGQAEHLMPLIQQTLADAGATLQELSAIGAGIGPGNFTGIRISVSAARGMALALGIPAVGISALDAQAHGIQGPVVSCLDARQGKFFTQAYNFGGPSGPSLTALEDIPLPPSRAEADVVGHRAAEVAARTGGRVLPTPMPIAIATAHLAAARMHHTHLPRPAPLYIKPADAAPSREQGPTIL